MSKLLAGKLCIVMLALVAPAVAIAGGHLETPVPTVGVEEIYSCCSTSLVGQDRADEAWRAAQGFKEQWDKVQSDLEEVKAGCSAEVKKLLGEAEYKVLIDDLWAKARASEVLGAAVALYLEDHAYDPNVLKETQPSGLIKEFCPVRTALFNAVYAELNPQERFAPAIPLAECPLFTFEEAMNRYGKTGDKSGAAIVKAVDALCVRYDELMEHKRELKRKWRETLEGLLDEKGAQKLHMRMTVLLESEQLVKSAVEYAVAQGMPLSGELCNEGGEKYDGVGLQACSECARMDEVLNKDESKKTK